MKDEVKTKAQLIDELAAARQSVAQLHQRLIELEALEVERQPIGVRSSIAEELGLDSDDQVFGSLVTQLMRQTPFMDFMGNNQTAELFKSEILVEAIAVHLNDQNLHLDSTEGSQPITDTAQRNIAPTNQQQTIKTLPNAPHHFQFPEHRQLRKIFAFIEANYHSSIGLNEIAQEFGYTPSYLTSLVRRLTGQTVYQWIVQRRMFQARYLLLETELAIYQIAEAVGYVDTGHFVKHFRQLHNQPPKTWREQQRHR